MGMTLVIAFFAASVDRLYWAVFKERDMRVDPKGGGPGGPLMQAVLAGIGGAAGAFLIARVTGSTDLFTAIVGAFIGGRLVGGIAGLATTPRQ
jgi:hypothetical protein